MIFYWTIAKQILYIAITKMSLVVCVTRVTLILAFKMTIAEVVELLTQSDI